ncbi:putative DNAJ domain protein [Leptomonas seymouri]|uniref:Putative DNAJ domain protein n=1 Tax=Leptomonas seymouri TaxID=5684 RepID=A0A0N1PB03_LEPSE|nr:putative DNAJ domain protein [Leptomonas seymouri]|eukprot:KPI86154.1 putative DNAJ domain protein [Leptomonas seymouri]
MPFSPKPTGGAAAGGMPATPSARAKTLYDILGVAQSATTAEITTSYRKLALVYHPDRPDGSKDKFQELNSAYEMLGNPAGRSKYDTLLKGKPALKNFKRPASMEKVERPVYTLLADLTFYEFEASPSKLRCSFHYGDGIEFNGKRGSFIGLAGDGCLYWSVNGRGYATPLCNAESDMALSNARILYRSNMGLRRKPLERSWAGKHLPLQQQQRAATHSPVSTPPGSGPANFSKTTGGGGPRLSEAERIREQLRNKERHRSATKRLEAVERDEAEERNDLEHRLWNGFLTFHTNLEAGMRCVTRGMPVTAELARFMGYMSTEEVPLVSPLPSNLPATAEHESSPAADSWVDPLCCDNAEYKDNARNERDALGQQQQQKQSPSLSSSSSASSRSSGDADTASDSDSYRDRAMPGQELNNGTGYTTAYASTQQSGSSPTMRGALYPTMSAPSSLGNTNQQQSPAVPANLRSTSWVSSPSAYGLPAVTAAPQGLAVDARPVPAPHAIYHTLQGSSGTERYASSAPWPMKTKAAASASVGFENEDRVKTGSSREGSQVNRASSQEAGQPSSLPASSSLLACSNLRHNRDAAPPNTTEATAVCFVSLLRAQSAGAGADADQVDAPQKVSKGAATPSPRPLYPWTSEHSLQSNLQARTAVHEAIFDPPARRTAELERCHIAAPPVAAASAASAPQHVNPRCSIGSFAAKGSTGDGDGGASPPSPSPKALRERTPAPSSLSHSPAAGADSLGRHLKPSPSLNGSPPMVMQGSAVGDEGSGPVKLQLPMGQATRPTVAAGHTPEVDLWGSPRPVAPSKFLNPTKAAGPVEVNGRSAAIQPFLRDESGGDCISHCARSADSMNPSVEGGPHMGTARVLSAAGSFSATAISSGSGVKHGSPSRHAHSDVLEGSWSSPPQSAFMERSTAVQNVGFFTPVDAPAVRGSGDASAAALLSSATTAGASSPRVTVVPLRVPATQEYALPQIVQDGEVDPLRLSPNAAAALEKKRRSKGRVTQRYMLATEAHARRTSGLPLEVVGSSGQTPSPRVEAPHAYKRMTAEEMLAEEEGFMSSFAKTKRVI